MSLCLLTVLFVYAAGLLWVEVKAREYEEFQDQLFLKEWIRRVGICPVCALHRWGFEHGYEVSPFPEHHECIDEVEERIEHESDRTT